ASYCITIFIFYFLFSIFYRLSSICHLAFAIWHSASAIPPKKSLVLIILVIIRIRMQRIPRTKEQITEPHGSVLASHRPALAASERFEVGSLLAQHAFYGLAPRGVARERVFGILRHPLDGEAEQVDAVAGRK